MPQFRRTGTSQGLGSDRGLKLQPYHLQSVSEQLKGTSKPQPYPGIED